MAERIIIVNSHPLFTGLLKHHIENQENYKVIGCCRLGSEALVMIGDGKPRLVLIDELLPDMRGVEVVSMLANSVAGIRYIVLSSSTWRHKVAEIMKAGVSGLLTTDISVDTLHFAIREVLAGRRFLSETVKTVIADGFLDDINPSNKDTCLEKLTFRETEIVRLIANEKITKEIAYELGITIRTVNVHKSNIMRKLGVSTIAGLTKYAFEQNLVAVSA